MAGALTLRVITPDHIVLDTQTSAIKVPATDGSMGILPRHAAMVAALDVGLLTYEAGGKEESLFVSGGFVEVRSNTVRVITEASEVPSEIDEERARAAEQRARKRLDQARAGHPADDFDGLRAELALRRALSRLRAVHGRRS